MLWLIFGCFIVALIGIIGMIVVYHESKRPDILIISDHIEMGRVKKFLNLTENERRRVVGEKVND
ncbi:MAG: hypothetical protein AAGK05_03900 [Pseudomonadota bacterium]